MQTRTPVILGMATASLNHFAPGRFALGLGLSSKIIVRAVARAELLAPR